MTQNRLAYLEQLLASNPNDAFVLFAIAKEHEKLGDAEQAIAFYERLRQSSPDYVGLYYHLGKLHEKEQRIDVALSVYKAGMQVAQQQKDMHAYSELNGARLNHEDDDI